jgi:serine/threonine protein kinase
VHLVDENTQQKIKTGEYEEIDGPEDLRKLIRNLLKVNPDERITYSEIKKLPFLSEYFDAYE